MISVCSFWATLPETKMPRCPTSSCTSPMITWPLALISAVLEYTSATQFIACWGGVMLSPFEEKMTMGERMALRFT